MADKISDDDDTYSQSSLDSIEDQQESEEVGSKSQCSSDKKCCSDLSNKCVNLLKSENQSASIYEGGNNTDKSDSGSSDYEHKNVAVENEGDTTKKTSKEFQKDRREKQAIKYKKRMEHLIKEFELK